MPVIQSFNADNVTGACPSTGCAPGTEFYLDWSIKDAITCSIDNGVGNVPCVPYTGEITMVAPTVTTTYTLTAVDDAGATVDRVTIAIR
jgi:hypothetical protein